MLVVSMAIFAVVMAAAALGGVWLTMSGYASGAQRADARHANLLTLIGELETRIEKTSGTALRAEVDGLAAALDSMSGSNRREFGKLWGKFTKGVVVDEHWPPTNANDDVFDAVVKWQTDQPHDPTKA